MEGWEFGHAAQEKSLSPYREYIAISIPFHVGSPLQNIPFPLPITPPLLLAFYSIAQLFACQYAASTAFQLAHQRCEYTEHGQELLLYRSLPVPHVQEAGMASHGTRGATPHPLYGYT